MTTVSLRPTAFVLSEFLTDAECDWVRSYASSRMVRSARAHRHPCNRTPTAREFAAIPWSSQVGPRYDGLDRVGGWRAHVDADLHAAWRLEGDPSARGPRTQPDAAAVREWREHPGAASAQMRTGTARPRSAMMRYCGGRRCSGTRLARSTARTAISSTRTTTTASPICSRASSTARVTVWRPSSGTSNR